MSQDNPHSQNWQSLLPKECLVSSSHTTVGSSTIKQRTKCDCMVASLAMLLKCSYEEAVQYFPPLAVNKTGYWQHYLLPYLFQNDIYTNAFVGDQISLVDWSKPSMVEVPSINGWEGGHIIYWDGQKVHDPSNGECYTELPEKIYHVMQLS